MNKEYVLDVGIGSGGDYLRTSQQSNEIRIGFDVSENSLQLMHERFPHVLAVAGKAQDLPFSDNVFKRIEIYLPFNNLLQPGLQQNGIDGRKDKSTLEDFSFYPEFYRTLKPSGKLIIYGDNLVIPEQIRISSQGLFIVSDIKNMTQDEFNQIQSSTSRARMNKAASQGRRYLKSFISKCHIVSLKSKKTA